MIFLMDSTEPFLQSTHISSGFQYMFKPRELPSTVPRPAKNSHFKVPTHEELARHDCSWFYQSIGTQW